MDEFIEAPALSTTLPSLKKDQSYEVTVNAATDIGYNDTLALSTITIPKSSDGEFLLHFLHPRGPSYRLDPPD